MNINELVFIDNFDNHVVVMSEVVRLLKSYRQMQYVSTEAGGVLIGERRGPHIVITHISERGRVTSGHVIGLKEKVTIIS